MYLNNFSLIEVYIYKKVRLFMSNEKKKQLEIQKQFIHSVKEQLSLMSEEEKDEWIVLQTKLLIGKRYDDFMMIGTIVL